MRSDSAIPKPQEATETSPLLAQSTVASPDSALTPNGAPPNQAGVTVPRNEHSKPLEDEESQNDGEDRGHQFEGMPDVKEKLWYIVPAVGIGVFLSAADQTIIVSCYGKIGSDLKSLENTSWIATAYLLSLSSFQPLYGKMSDIFGRKSCLLFAYTIFSLGCLWCGLARDMNELIAARAFSGIGGGGMTTVVSIILSDIIPLRERGTWQGIINIIYALGAGCGAPLGGLLADRISWRWAFLAQAPMCAAALLGVSFVLRLPKQDASNWKTKLRRIDFLGAFVLVAAIFLLLLGLDRGSNNSWSAPITITSLSVSLPLFILFAFVELKLAVEPFAPGRIIFKRSLLACYLCNFFGFGSWMAILFYIPLFYQAVDGFSATQAGVRLLPNVIAAVSGSLTGGLLMQRTGKYYWLTVVAYSTTTLGTLLIILCTGLVVNNTYGISTGLVLGGFCLGIGTTTTLIGLIANAAPEDQALATACSYLFRSLGSVVILSLSSSVVQQSLRNQLREKLNNGENADEVVKRVRQSLDYVNTLGPAVRKTVRQCFATSTRNGFVFVLGIACCAMLASYEPHQADVSRESAVLVQDSPYSTASESSALAVTVEMSSTQNSSRRPSVPQGRNEVNSGEHSASLRGLARPLVPTSSFPNEDTTIEQLRQVVAIQHATILRYEAEAQESERFRSQFFQRSAAAEEGSIKHAETLNQAIVELEATINPGPRAAWIPRPGECTYRGYDLAERYRPGRLTQIGVVRAATCMVRLSRGSTGSDDTTGATVEAQTYLANFSAELKGHAEAGPSRSAEATADEMVEEEREGMGAAVLRNQTRTVTERAYAPITPLPSTQEREPRNEPVSKSSNAQSGGRGGAGKRRMEEDGENEASEPPRKARRNSF